MFSIFELAFSIISYLLHADLKQKREREIAKYLLLIILYYFLAF